MITKGLTPLLGLVMTLTLFLAGLAGPSATTEPPRASERTVVDGAAQATKVSATKVKKAKAKAKAKAKKAKAKKAKAKAKKAKIAKAKAKIAKAKAKAKKKAVSRPVINKIIKAPYPPKMTKAQAKKIAKRVRKEPTPGSIKYSKKEPATRAAWQKMFHSLPTTEWGGADVSVSIRLESGRRLWVYGDTLSTGNGFMHSSAIVTTGKKARVANRGHQIMPTEKVDKEGRRVVYWTETLTPLAGEYALVTTTPISIKPGDFWGFYRVKKKSRQGLIHVDPRGDVRFIAWTGWVTRPDIGMDGEDFASPKKGHYTYGAFVHPIKLKNGKFLRTRNRNYDNWVWGGGWPKDLKMFRPTFEESKTRKSPYWGR